MGWLPVVGRGLGFVSVFTCAFWVPWAALGLAFWEYPAFTSTAALFVYSVAPGSIIALGYGLRTRHRGRTRSKLLRSAVLTTAVTLTVFLGLHFAHRRPPHFDFLGEHPVIMATDPGFPGFISWVYCYPAKPERVLAQAAMELRAKGYRVKTKNGRLSASMEKDEEYSEPQVDLSPERVTGKHFCVDGDCVDEVHDPGWVTVQVTQADLLPLWIQVFVP